MAAGPSRPDGSPQQALDRCPVDQFGDPLKPRIAPEPGRQQRIDEAHLIHPTHPPLSAKRITNRKTRLSFCRGLACGERAGVRGSANNCKLVPPLTLVSLDLAPHACRLLPTCESFCRSRQQATSNGERFQTPSPR